MPTALQQRCRLIQKPREEAAGDGAGKAGLHTVRVRYLVSGQAGTGESLQQEDGQEGHVGRSWTAGGEMGHWREA